LIGAAVALWAGPALAQPAKPALKADVVVATVDGEPITGSDVTLLFDTLPEQYAQFPMAALYAKLVEQLVNRKLLAMAARKEGVLDKPELKRRLAFLTEGIIEQIYYDKLIKDNVTEEALREAYRKQKSQATGEDEVRARHILVKSEAEAQAIIKQLQGGADFAELAKRKSTGPSGRQGGDLGFFAFGQMVPPFSAAAFALRPGDTTITPVKTQFGWHIIKVEERRTAGTSTYADSVEKLRAEMSQNVIYQVMEKLKKAATIRMMQGTGIKRVP
jgi:peptidyl-prolyl cis-trans isomerase C